jgi:hypothetical protein
MATHEQAATPGHDGGNEQQQPQLCRQPVPTSAIASASFFFFFNFFFDFNFLPALGRHSDGLRQSSRVD